MDGLVNPGGTGGGVKPKGTGSDTDDVDDGRMIGDGLDGYRGPLRSNLSRMRGRSNFLWFVRLRQNCNVQRGGRPKIYQGIHSYHFGALPEGFDSGRSRQWRRVDHVRRTDAAVADSATDRSGSVQLCQFPSHSRSN